MLYHDLVGGKLCAPDGDNQGCAHLCLLTSSTSSVCACAKGYRIKEDNKTCQGSYLI